jgi:hypothetical protein
MLPDRLSRLLTGFVDGQLSALEQKQALELLRRSAEARALLHHLQEDARLLGAMPHAQLSPEFSEQLQASLPQRLPRVAQFPKKPERRFSWRYAGVCAAAATLLLALGIAYLQKANRPVEINPGNTDGSDFAQGNGEIKPTNVAEVLPSPQSKSTLAQTPVPAAPPSRPEVLTVMPKAQAAAEAANIVTGPVSTNKPLRVVDPKVPLLLAMREIDQDQDKHRREIVEELALAPSWRLEFTCQESEIATSRLKRALQAQGIRLLIDPEASDRQKLRLKKTVYAVLVENVSPQECLAIVMGLRQVDREEQKRARSNNQFIDVKLSRIAPEDENRLETLFGIKALKPEMTPAKVVPAEVNSRDLAVLTLARALAIWRGQKPPEGQGSKRNAFLVADSTNQVRKASYENQLFLNSRQPPRPDLLQLLIVLAPRKG